MGDLDNLTEKLNEILLRAEAAFSTIKVPASVGVDGGTIIFKKSGDAWRLMWKPVNEEATPLVHAARSVRISAAEVMPKLFQAILDKQQETTDELQKTIDDLEQFVTALEHKIRLK